MIFIQVPRTESGCWRFQNLSFRSLLPLIGDLRGHCWLMTLLHYVLLNYHLDEMNEHFRSLPNSICYQIYVSSGIIDFQKEKSNAFKKIKQNCGQNYACSSRWTLFLCLDISLSVNKDISILEEGKTCDSQIQHNISINLKKYFFLNKNNL